MAYFESGVPAYVHGIYKVDVFFPVDRRGNEFKCCAQCFYFRESSSRCALNYEKCAFPDKNVGQNCPLIYVTEEQDDKLNAAIAEIAMENAQCPSMENNE